mmetsp:Transcript_104528/g.337110  ORF Transcript_104528/g.337110 Transcript_104528/m.337110 type:complete len:281 (+) Transcript_104528:77-919(+)
MWVIKEAMEHPRSSAMYASFFIGCIVVYKTIEARSTGQYDYMLTLAAGLQTLAFALLVFDTRSGVGEGLSEKTLWSLFTAHVTRLSTTIWGEGYIPEDNTSDVFLYQFLEASGVLLLAFQLLKLSTLRTFHDVGQGMESWTTFLVMVGVSMILAWNTKSTGHADLFADWSWMFSVWLEAFALGPQVWLLHVRNKVDESAMHFAGLTMISGVIFASFWGRTGREWFVRHQDYGENGFFWSIGVAAVIRVLLCAAYFYLFMRTARGGKGTSNGVELSAEEEL